MSVIPAPNSPHFLIIGAMKAGTTTLYRDLELHPDVFLPQEKEPETLVRLGDNREGIERDYASLFRGARDSQIRGEASTAYTKRPTFERAAARARDICGPDLKLIYLMREPVGRMVSQYRHEFGLHETDLSLEDAFAQDHRYAEYSRYDYQLEPWRAEFPGSQILLLSFEDYVRDRSATLAVVCQFLGIDAGQLPQPENDKAFNASEGKPVARGLVGRFVTSPLYQRGIKQAVPRGLRERAMKALLPKARTASGKLDPDMRAKLASRFEPYAINNPALPPDA